MTSEENQPVTQRCTDPEFQSLQSAADQIYQNQKRSDNPKRSNQRAIQLYQILLSYLDDSYAWNQGDLYRRIGNCYYAMGDRDHARKNLEKSLEYTKGSAAVYRRLASIYYAFDQDKAIAYNTRAFDLDNDFVSYSSRNFLTLQTDAYRPEEVREKLEGYAADWPQRLKANGRVYTHERLKTAGKLTKDRKLRIAYLSSDFYSHTMMSFVVPLLEHHDTAKYDITLYSTVKNYDKVTTHTMKLGNRFVDCFRLNIFDLAKRVYDDEIDILVDLGGFTYGHNRSFTMLFKPAPIQVQYLGFLGTYGFKEVDYIMSDKFTIPEEDKELYTEEPMYIDAGMERFNFIDEKPLPDITSLPMKKNGYITFGSFNSIAKITETTLRLWAKLMQAVPSAHLLIYRYGTRLTPDKIEQLYQRLERFGVERSRVEFSTERLDPHYKAYDLADIALDPTPFGGLSITIEALHMGVPTLTCPSRGMASRGTARVNRMFGLENQLTASDEEDFAKKGAALAADHEKLRYYRENLRGIVQNSPLTQDLDGFARSVEAAYDKAWFKYVDEHK